MKTSDLTGPALDWAVAKLEGWAQSDDDGFWRRVTHKRAYAPEYSKQWMWGGPIIEREEIRFGALHAVQLEADPNLGKWCADLEDNMFEHTGPTPLIAAMRCYVASRLGDEVNIPSELTK